MPNVALYNIAGQSIGELELKESIFGIEPNASALHAVVKAYLANQRQGTQSALTRAEVRGGGIKIYRQKGTGAPATAATAHRSSPTAAWCLRPSRATTARASTRR